MTLEQIDASIGTLLAAIGTGTLNVRFADGRSVTYQSVADMKEALSILRSERSALTAGAGAGGRPVAVINAFSVRIVR